MRIGISHCRTMSKHRRRHSAYPREVTNVTDTRTENGGITHKQMNMVMAGMGSEEEKERKQRRTLRAYTYLALVCRDHSSTDP